jgi:hypothetical protein
LRAPDGEVTAVDRGTFIKGSTAVAPAPIFHEFVDGSKQNTAKEELEPTRMKAESEGLLVVMTSTCASNYSVHDQLQAGTHTSDVLKQLLPDFSPTQVGYPVYSLASLC